MKRKITLSIALALSVVLLSLMSSDRAAKAQPGGRLFIADTGIVKFGPNQVLRVTVYSGDANFNSVVRFRRMEYTKGTCSGEGVCKHTVSSQTTTNPVALAPGEAVSFESRTSPFADGLVLEILSNSQDVRVNASIVNSITDEVDAFFDIFTEFRRCQFPLCG